MNVSEFLIWWRDGLTGCVPHALRKRLAPSPPRVTVQRSDEGCIFRLLDSDGSELDALTERFFPASDRPSEALRTWLAATERRSPRYEIVMEAGEALVTDIALPSAAADNVGDVLGFEMDRFTPFAADDVYFGFHVLGATSESVRARVALVPRRRADDLVQALAHAGVTVDTLIPADPDAPAIAHGLPGRAHAAGASRTRLMLTLTAAALAGLAIYLPFHLTSSRLAEIETRLTALKRDAMELRRLQDRLDEALKGAKAVTQRKAAEPSTLEVLSEVTRVLPENAWAYRFNRVKDELSIQGEATVATELLGHVESSPMFRNATFRSTVQRNNVTGRDRYQITAQIVGDSAVARAGRNTNDG